MKSLTKLAIYFAALAAATLILTELGVRAIVQVNNETGIPLLGRVALLPWRPLDDYAIRTLRSARQSQYIVRDSDLGWSLQPNSSSGIYAANLAGLRGKKGDVVTMEAPTGVTRISVYGDSFTHGDDVVLEDTWAYRWAQLRPSTEVLNFGVPAYGMDQAYLRYLRDGSRYKSHMQILCIWPEDIIRNLNIIRFYMTPHGNLGPSKPRLLLDGTGLRVVNSPVMSDSSFADTLLDRRVSPLMMLDRLYTPHDVAQKWYYASYAVRAVTGIARTYERKRERERQYFEPESEANQLAARIATAFADKVKSSGAEPYVVIIPARDYLDRHESGGWPLVPLLERAGISVIDLGPVMAKAARSEGAEKLFLSDGHMTPLGNQRIAEALDRAITARRTPLVQ